MKYSFKALILEFDGSIEEWSAIIRNRLNKKLVVSKTNKKKAIKVLKEIYAELLEQKPSYQISIRKAYYQLEEKILKSEY